MTRRQPEARSGCEYRFRHRSGSDYHEREIPSMQTNRSECFHQTWKVLVRLESTHIEYIRRVNAEPFMCERCPLQIDLASELLRKTERHD